MSKISSIRNAMLVAVGVVLGLVNGRAAEVSAPLPEALTSFGAVTVEGSLYVYGGHLGQRRAYCSNDVSSALLRLNLSPDATWETLPSNVPAQSPVLVAEGSYLYRLGGMTARNPQGQSNDLWSLDSAARFNLQTKVWEALPSLPEARSSADGCVVNHKLFLVGGWKLAGQAESVWPGTALVLDLVQTNANWRVLPQPFKRRGIALAALGAKLYCIGGLEAEGSSTLAVNVLNTENDEWSAGPPIPDGKLSGFGVAACVADGRLYMSDMDGILWRLKAQADGWEEAGHLATPRMVHRLVPGGHGQILAVGGQGEKLKLRDIEIVTLSKDP